MTKIFMSGSLILRGDKEKIEYQFPYRMGVAEVKQFITNDFKKKVQKGKYAYTPKFINLLKKIGDAGDLVTYGVEYDIIEMQTKEVTRYITVRVSGAFVEVPNRDKAMIYKLGIDT